MMTMIVKRSHSRYKYSCGVILLLALFYSYSAHADSIIDHVNTRQEDSKEIIEIVFNQPVQYLYHTPKSDTKTMLLGFYLPPPWIQEQTRHRPISFRRGDLLNDIELYYEKGFNPHLYLEFNTRVNIEVQPMKDLRGFVLTLGKTDK